MEPNLKKGISEETDNIFPTTILALNNTTPVSSNKGRKIKSIKLEMKMERSQQTTQKYKGS